MTHFTVAVFAESEKELISKMLPFHTYEADGIDEYTQFVGEMDDDEILESFLEERAKGDYIESTLQEFAEDYYGYIFDNETKMWGRKTNPNSKWDWWVVGGRYTGFFPNNPTSINELRELQKNILNNKMAQRSDFLAAREKAPDQERIESAKLLLAESEIMRKFYDGDAEKAARDLNGLIASDEFAFWWYERVITDYLLPEDEYKNNILNKAPVHAFINQNGEWIERGSTGWFGYTGNENDDTFNQDFFLWAEKVKDNIYILDCHY